MPLGQKGSGSFYQVNRKQCCEKAYVSLDQKGLAALPGGCHLQSCKWRVELR